MSLRRICDHCYQPIAPETIVLRIARHKVTAHQTAYDYMVDYGPAETTPLPISEFCAWPCLIAYARETAATEDVANSE